MNNRVYIIVVPMLLCFLTLNPGCATKTKTFPAQQITLICPYAPGSTSDLVTHTLAHFAEKEFKVPVIVENKTGGGGAVGMDFGAHSKPDGYTVTYLVAEIALLPYQGFNPIYSKDFDLLFRINYSPAALTVPADAPWKNFQDFAEHVKKHPNELRVSNPSTFSIWHLAAVLLEQKLNTHFIHIPHKGTSPAVEELLGGHVDAVTVNPIEIQRNVETGNLRMLAILGDKRAPGFPDVPTAKELGYDVDIGTWGGLAVPRGAPEPARKTLIAGFKKAFHNAKFQKIMKNRGIQLAWIEGKEFEDFVKSQSDMIGEIIKKSEIK